MTHTWVNVLVGGWLAASLGCAAPAHDTDGQNAGTNAPDPDSAGAYVPKWKTVAEHRNRSEIATRKQALTTPPPGPVDAKPEWAKLDGVLIKWPTGWPEILDTYLNMLAAIQMDSKAYVQVTSNSARTRAQSEIRSCEACSLAADKIEWVIAPSDGPWMRDYGPEFVAAGPSQTAGIIDLSYYPERSYDDAFPISFGETYSIPSYTTSLALEGGNFQTDGNGNCFASKGASEANGGERRLREAFATYFGCKKTILIDYLKEEGTHHIDMWMKLLSPTAVIVGDYTYDGSEQLQYPDTDNDVILDRVAAQMKSLGYEVFRIPQPSSYYMPSEHAYTIRTYTNSQFANNVIMVPVYNEPTDNVALDIYSSALKQSVKPVGVDSRYIIEWGGAMHCLSMEKHALD